ncbi:hypothetical protein [Halorhodospira halochloris]|nr:hypothetical protein [Halorhodospira halochloris]MBK1653013.1 hypothetical protein [Halorhodospira halochloris]
MDWIETLGIPSLLVIIAGWLGKRYLDKKLEYERALYKSQIASLEGSLRENLEVHKQKLKNSEFIFREQYHAVLQLYKLKKDMVPEKRYPDMEWGDALEEMAQSANETRKQLEAFREKYFAVLSPGVVEKLESASSSCIDAELEGPDFPGTQFIDLAFNRIEECTSLLKSDFDGQRNVKFQRFERGGAQKGPPADSENERR